MRTGHGLLLALLTTLLGCAPESGMVGVGGNGETPGVVPIAGDAGAGGCAHPEEGCECGPEQPPIDCHLDPIINADGTLTCNSGTRYCRDGVWTACESLRSYVLGATGEALLGSPTSCSPCDPRCFSTVDRPNDGDLTPGNSSDVSYDPSRGGIQITPNVPMIEELTDSDGDGIPDVADECPGQPGAFRNADGSCYGDRFIVHTLPFGESAVDPLDIRTQLRTADVYFLIDTTGSMGGELARLRSDLTSGSFISGCGNGIIGAIRCTIPDAWFGVGYFDDFPYGSYGYSGDRVYRNVQDITSTLSLAQTAVNSLSIHSGADGPESNTQALWAVATGGGFGSYLSARTGCPTGRWGYPCFRDGTIPIIIHITDAPFHNGPGGAYTYSSAVPAVSWNTVINALNARNVRVITMQTCGYWSNSYCKEGENHAKSLANATGSTNGSGTPYVFRGSDTGAGLSSAIVDAVVDLANYSRMDVSARVVGDTRGFTQLPITALSFSPSGACTGIVGGNTFRQCLPGTTTNFRVTFRNDVVMPTMVAQVFSFFIEIIGDGSVLLGRVPVRIVVPPFTNRFPDVGTFTRDYDTTLRCALDERPDWGNFSWNADVPAGTQLEFEIRAADTVAGLASAPVVRITVPTATSPRDIAALLRSAGYPNGMRVLRITAVLRANSDRSASPALRTMEVAYTCVPAE